MRAMFRVLGFWGMLECILLSPYTNLMYYIYDKKLHQIAESKGMTYEDYIESMVIYRRDDGTIVTDAAERESLRKKYKKKEEARERAIQLARLKQIYGYKDF